jgi:hypothetical protein
MASHSPNVLEIEMKKAHEVAIDWALARGYNISVKDRCQDNEWDVVHSHDRQEILDACEATDVPNVYIFNPMWNPEPGIMHGICHKYLLTFSVIDEGIPAETINDYTAPSAAAAEWRREAFAAFEKAIHYSNWEEPLKKYKVTLRTTVIGTYFTEALSFKEAEECAHGSAVLEWGHCEYGDYTVIEVEKL